MRAISHHQLRVYKDCPQRWHYMYEDLWTPQKTVNDPMNRGTLLHQVLELHYREGTYEAEQFISTLLAEPANLARLKMLNDVVRTYKLYQNYAKNKDKYWQVLGVEFEFVVPTVSPQGRPFAWRGFIDLIVKDISTGEVLCVDHKSSDGQPKSQRRTRLDPQLPIYAWAIQELGLFGGKVDGLVYNFLNTHDYKRKVPTEEELFERRKTFITDRELKFLMAELNRSVDELHTPSLNNRMNIDGDRCSRCKFQEICEARMKGIDPTPLLINNFEKREAAIVDLDEKEVS